MAHNRNLLVLTATTGLLLAALLVGLVYGLRPASDADPISAQSAIATPEITFYTGITPLYADDEVISRTLKLFPEGKNPHGAVARLLPYETVDDWRDASGPDVQPDSPAWLVGILGDNLTVEDIMSDYEPGQAGVSGGDVAIEGAFYVWDANSGFLTGVGVLHPSGSRTYATLASLFSVPMTIEAATELPPYPTDTPPTPGAPTETSW